MNTARGPAVPNSLFVWKVRLWLLALGVALVVNDQTTSAPPGQQARATADRIACTVPASARPTMQRVSPSAQAKDCSRQDRTATPPVCNQLQPGCASAPTPAELSPIMSASTLPLTESHQ